MQQPKFGSVRFSCPHCGALAHQYWYEVRATALEKDRTPTRFEKDQLEKLKSEQLKKPIEERYSDFSIIDEFMRSTSGEVFKSTQRGDPYSYTIYNTDISQCDSCGDIALWISDRLAYPKSGPVGLASNDMPPIVRGLYDEAGSVFSTSPRSAAAILRLALQHLLIELGQPGKNINNDINSLIEKGLDEDIAKPMHALRIIGNESVHPGLIDVNDEPYIAEALFDLLNQIVEQMITKPRKREELWNSLPEEKRKQVEDRLQKKKD